MSCREPIHFACHHCINADFRIYLPSEEAVAQTTAKDLGGTWTLVSITLEQDGKKTDFYGPNPQGQRTFDPTGHFSEITIDDPVLITSCHVSLKPNNGPVINQTMTIAPTRTKARGCPAARAAFPEKSENHEDILLIEWAFFELRYRAIKRS